MDRQGAGEDGLPTSALLPREVSAPGSHGRSIMPASDPAVMLLVVFSTVIAVGGSFMTGCATGYSSPAESGIMEDLGLSSAVAMWLSQILCAAGWLSMAFAENAWWLDIKGC